MATLSALEDHTGFWLRFVSNHVSQAFARRLERSNVTVAEWVLLRHMYDYKQTSSSHLSQLTGLTRGATSKLIDRLLVKALVSREYRTDDRRYQDVALTSAGRKLVPSLAALADRNDREFFAPLTSAEHRALLATLRKLVELHGLKSQPIE